MLSYLKDLIFIKEIPAEEEAGITTRSMDAPLLNTPKSGTMHYKNRAFSTAAPVLWNHLPKDIRQIHIVSKIL